MPTEELELSGSQTSTRSGTLRSGTDGFLSEARALPAAGLREPAQAVACSGHATRRYGVYHPTWSHFMNVLSPAQSSAAQNKSSAQLIGTSLHSQLNSSVPHCTRSSTLNSPHCTALHRTAPHCTALHRTAPHCCTCTVEVASAVNRVIVSSIRRHPTLRRRPDAQLRAVHAGAHQRGRAVQADLALTPD